MMLFQQAALTLSGADDAVSTKYFTSRHLVSFTMMFLQYAPS
jgi:hypothetical protein